MSKKPRKMALKGPAGYLEQPDPTTPFVEEPQDSPNYLSDEDVEPTSTPTTTAPKKMQAKAGPASYEDAAKLIRADKALYAQYKAGVASGKAFSLQVGGKQFKYAATPKKAPVAAKERVTGLSGGNIAAGITQDTAETMPAGDKEFVTSSPQKMAKKAAEQVATPDDTASNMAIATANRRKMKPR